MWRNVASMAIADRRAVMLPIAHNAILIACRYACQIDRNNCVLRIAISLPVASVVYCGARPIGILSLATTPDVHRHNDNELAASEL